MVVEQYVLLHEPDKTMFVFTKQGRFYGHIVKRKTDKAPAKLVFETPLYDTMEQLKAEYPELVGTS
ncbi:hypothetical protein LJK88_01820 [Paenibacillus sp. P26]|nr:hypothetical protein LJK88_01820 [Paenibacillus sp. P26]UUZ91062.1 hypothetical protein LJK87_35655 [Paenibacillus sp. P25]